MSTIPPEDEYNSEEDEDYVPPNEPGELISYRPKMYLGIFPGLFLCCVAESDDSEDGESHQDKPVKEATEEEALEQKK